MIRFMFRFFACMISLVAMSTSVFGQEAPQVDARQMYEQNAYQLVQPFTAGVSERMSLASSPSAKGARRMVIGQPQAGAVPGDNERFAILKLNREFYEFGDRLVARLIGIQSQSAFTITGRVSYYNEVTQQSEARFFTPEVCGYRGYCPAGLSSYQNLIVYTEEFSAASATGGYAIDFTIWNADGSGILRQQVFAYYYLGHTPNWGRIPLFVGKATTSTTPFSSGSLVLEGMFPQGEDVVVWMGNVTEGFSAVDPAAKVVDGRFLVLQQPFGFGPGERPVDIVVFSPSWRMCAVLPTAYIGKQTAPSSR